ncbi:MAG: rRNA maturation RNase YbeY [Deltaproteobacteria bacterium]|nr:rRNA maturation RNase YbeY [Deltaproteobacteria bacterium]
MKARRGRLLVSGARLLRADKRVCLRAARRLFRAARAGEIDVGLVFVHDLEMRALNRAWRGKDAPTDVLAFAAHEGEPVPGAEHTLGDLVVSVDTARRQARALGHAVEEEIAVLVAHGLAHLCGFDHEKGTEQAEAQRSCEMTLLAGARFDVALALSARAP